MFSLGPMEMAIVGVVAVLLFGKRLPEVMRSLGKSYNEFRKGLADIHSTVNFNDFGSPTAHGSNRSQDFSDYDEPTAPRFDPPPAPPSEPGTPSGDTDKPIGEK